MAAGSPFSRRPSATAVADASRENDGDLNRPQVRLLLIVKDLEHHRGDAGGGNPDDVGGGTAQIDDPIIDKGTAIVDPHDHRLLPTDGNDPHDRIERKRPVRSGKLVGVEGFSVGGEASLKLASVP
jgi:hypothetical protein